MAQGSDPWNDVRELLARIEELVSSSHPRGGFDVARPDEATLSMYWRCVSLFRSVLLLLDNRYPEEALILARSLFEESLRLKELQDAGNDREAFLVGYYAEALERQEELFGPSAERLGLTEDASDVVESARRQKGQLENYRKRKNIGKRKKFSTVRVAATKQNRRKDLWIHLLSHHMVHGGEPAYIYRRHNVGENAIALYSNTNDPHALAEVGAFAARSVSHALYAAAGISGWEISPELRKLVNELAQRINGT
jgi:hypothetical protein